MSGKPLAVKLRLVVSDSDHELKEQAQSFFTGRFGADPAFQEYGEYELFDDGTRVCVAAFARNRIVGLYALPAFELRECYGLVNGSSFGLLSAWPEGRGIASQLVAGVSRVFNRVAYLTGAEALHHRVSTSRPNIFRRHGYTDTGYFSFKGGKVVRLEKRFPSSDYRVSGLELEIAKAISENVR